MRFFEILTFIGAAIGGLLIVSLYLSSGVEAPQRTSLTALAMAIVGVPYCVLATLQRRELLRRSDMNKG